MLDHLVNDPRAWRANTIDDRSRWYYPLPEKCLAALERTAKQVQGSPRPVTELKLADTPFADCVSEFKPVLDALENGRGFSIVTGLPRARFSPEVMRLAYWLVGQCLGMPIEQNVQGTLLYDVTDTGQDVRYGARFSVTNAESSFHTDNSFGAETADYVGLLCINPAKSGGVNLMVSAWSVHNEMSARNPEALRLLYEPFHIDRRGGVKADESVTAQFPIFRWDGRELECRYLRYWIEVGQEKIGRPLTPAQIQALDILDESARDPKLTVDFTLQPGDMFFINNRWTLHNRTAFEDFPEPDRRRFLVRLWLKK